MRLKNDEVDYVDYEDVSISEIDASSSLMVMVEMQANQGFPVFENRMAAYFAVYLKARKDENLTPDFEVVSWQCSWVLDFPSKMNSASESLATLTGAKLVDVDAAKGAVVSN